ncbi:hypothetical protein EV2_025682 [Malus domestica]
MEISIADCHTSPSGGLPTQTGDRPNQTDDSSLAAITAPRDIAQNGLDSDIPNGPCNPCDFPDCDNAKNGPDRDSPSGPYNCPNIDSPNGRDQLAATISSPQASGIINTGPSGLDLIFPDVGPSDGHPELSGQMSSTIETEHVNPSHTPHVRVYVKRVSLG